MPARTLAALALLGLATASTTAAVELDSAAFGSLSARAIGPAVMSGRISAVVAVPQDPLRIYAGSAGGGLWRSKDGGLAWDPIFDDYNPSIGAVALDPRNPSNVWVGTGESWMRNSVSVGDGVYKSTDGGESWKKMGLPDSEHIARIRVSPADGKTAFVCATGPLWSSGGERGVYKTSDGGETWKPVLTVNADTGCSDLDLDPQDPRVLYAGMWQFRRTGWSFSSGGPGSGLYKSTDGGESWRAVDPRPAGRGKRPDHGRRGAVADQRGLRPGRGQEDRPLPLGRHGGELHRGQRFLRRGGAAVLLRPPGGRSRRLEPRLQARPRLLLQRRWRQDLRRQQLRHLGALRSPRPLDRSPKPEIFAHRPPMAAST